MGSVRLHHVGWTFDSDGNLSGSFTLDEKDSVDSQGQSYEGSFDQKFYDVNGILLREVTGTLAATRITVD